MAFSRHFLIEVATAVQARKVTWSEGENEGENRPAGILLPRKAAERELQKNSGLSGVSDKVQKLIERRYAYPVTVSDQFYIVDRGEDLCEVRLVMMVESQFDDKVEKEEVNNIFNELRDGFINDFEVATEKMLPHLAEIEGEEYGKLPSEELLKCVDEEIERPADKVEMLNLLRGIVDEKTGGEREFTIAGKKFESVFVPPQASTVKAEKDETLTLMVAVAFQTTAHCTRPDSEKNLLGVYFAKRYEMLFAFAKLFQCSVEVTGRYLTTSCAGKSQKKFNVFDAFIVDPGNHREFSASVYGGDFLGPISVSQLNRWLMPWLDDDELTD